MFPNEKLPNYIDRIKSINMATLESQRVITDLCTLFKLINGMIDVPFNPVCSARNHSRIIYQSTKSCLFRNSFFHRALMLWNKYIATRSGLSTLTYSSFVSSLSKLHSKLFFGSASKAE